jgi:hypothetical protein
VRAHHRGVAAEHRTGVEQQHHFGLGRRRPIFGHLGPTAEPLETVAVDGVDASDELAVRGELL